jgi:hypothetical protein
MPTLVLKVYMRTNNAKATPHFLFESNAGIEIAQKAISIQLFRSSMSPLAIKVAIKKMLTIIHTAMAYSIGDLLVVSLVTVLASSD